MSYRIRLSSSAARTLTDGLPESIAAAAAEFIYGALAENPQRVGKPLRLPYAGCHGARRGDYRVIYRIDQVHVLVDVIKINHRRVAYRP